MTEIEYQEFVRRCPYDAMGDHSIHAWNILPHIFCANRFRDIEKIFPKENGLSKNADL